MQKQFPKLITLALALILCLSLLPMTALAAAPTVQTLAATNVTTTSATLNGKVTNDGGTAITEYDFILRWYEGKYEMTNRYESDQETTFVINGDGTFSFNVTLQTGVAYDYRAYARNGGTGTDVAYGEWVKVVDGGAAPTTPPSGNDPWSKASSWAVPELQKAQSMGLIPATLNGKDFTAPVSRAEFAAISVKLYENLSGKTATAPAKNPFTDTNDPEVLKAYNVGLTAGTAADKFSPNDLLTREQAATMLTRVYKAATISGWTLATDANFPLKYTKPAAFADDSKISDWAKDSVYFMVSKGIISGTGNNNFSPRATTSAEQASSYGTATREQALAIAVREVDNLKGTTPEVGTPSTPPNGSTSLVCTFSANGNPLLYTRANGKWVENTAKLVYPDSTLSNGFQFFSDGTFWEMEDWVWDSTGGGTSVGRDMGVIIRYGNYSTQGNQLILSNIRYDYIANPNTSDSQNKDQSGTSDDIHYYFELGTAEWAGNTHKTLFISKVSTDKDFMAQYYEVK